MDIIKNIKCADNIIILILKDNKYEWYLSNKYLWIMNYEKYVKAFDSKEDDFSQRFNIGVLDNEYIDIFLSNVETSFVTTAQLKDGFKYFLPISNWDDSGHLFPSLFINFDQKVLKSVYCEGLQFENYIPNNWTGIYDDFYSQIPIEMKYWIINGKNWFSVLLDNY